MNYFDNTITGGIQLFTDDLGWVQTSLRGAINKMLGSLAIDTNPNFIIQGCVPTIAPGVSCTVTAGYIYLNGEVLAVDAHVAPWASSNVYAYSKVSTTDTSANRTIKIGGGTAVPWLKDRGVCADVGVVIVTKLDVEGPTMLDKIKFGLGSASTTEEGLVELATDAETITGTDATRAVTPASLQAKVASTTAKGIAELATSAETITGTDAARVVTPAGLQAKVSSETEKGIIELATDAEAQTGTDTDRAITPANLSSRTATTTRSGILETSTDVETQTGTATDKIVTPSNLVGHEAYTVVSSFPHADISVSGTYPLRYKRLNNDLIVLNGRFIVDNAIGTTAQIITTLPAGYIPISNDVYFTIYDPISGNDTQKTGYVMTSGNVVISNTILAGTYQISTIYLSQ